MLIDTHAHLQDESLLPEVDQIIARAEEAGVEKIICVGYDLKSSQAAVELSRKYRQVSAAAGIHPHEAEGINESILAELYKLAADSSVLAIGEIGLDYYRDISPRDKQAEIFRAQIKIARELHKPIVIHDRDAHQDVLDIIKAEKAGQNDGIMHCYSGQWPLAVELMKEGFYISFAGPLTFKNSKKAREVAAKVPLDKVLVETDCPYLAPEPLRGKRNEPAYVAYVAKMLAEIRGKSETEIAYITNRNARKVFRIKD